MDCKHTESRVINERAYTGSVAEPPRTDEWRPAHGNIERTVECASCGAQRRELVNGAHVEVSPWGPSYAQRTSQAAQISEERTSDAAVLRDLGIRVVSATSSDVWVRTPDSADRRRLTIAECEEWSRHADPTVAATYREILRQAAGLAHAG